MKYKIEGRGTEYFSEVSSFHVDTTDWYKAHYDRVCEMAKEILIS